MDIPNLRATPDMAADIPPHHKAYVGHLKTFELPSAVGADEKCLALGKAVIDTWRTDGILQIKVTPEQGELLRESYEVSKAFFKLPHAEKAKLVDDQSYAGYIASGEEVTDGIADYSEIFTVFKDLPATDARVQNKWPGHGSCPWPSPNYAHLMKQLMRSFGESGEKLLKLIGLGLGLKDPDTLLRLTKDGWHHMRVLRFPQVDQTNGKGKVGRGIGSHTDYGLLVIASQTKVGALFVRPPVSGENMAKNWETSAAGLHEDDEDWMFVPPVENTLTVFPGIALSSRVILIP
jgi:isopenicillin N synthase-like dioxygenase